MARLRQRSTCKAALPLDVRTLRRENLLRANTAFVCTWTSPHGQSARRIAGAVAGGELTLSFEWRREGDSKWRSASQRVPLTTTPCHFGGERHWFMCPEIKGDGQVCNRRVALLYLSGGNPTSLAASVAASPTRSSRRTRAFAPSAECSGFAAGSAPVRTSSRSCRRGPDTCTPAPTLAYPVGCCSRARIVGTRSACSVVLPSSATRAVVSCHCSNLRLAAPMRDRPPTRHFRTVENLSRCATCFASSGSISRLKQEPNGQERRLMVMICDVCGLAYCTDLPGDVRHHAERHRFAVDAQEALQDQLRCAGKAEAAASRAGSKTARASDDVVALRPVAGRAQLRPRAASVMAVLCSGQSHAVLDARGVGRCGGRRTGWVDNVK